GTAGLRQFREVDSLLPRIVELATRTDLLRLEHDVLPRSRFEFVLAARVAGHVFQKPDPDGADDDRFPGLPELDHFGDEVRQVLERRVTVADEQDADIGRANRFRIDSSVSECWSWCCYYWCAASVRWLRPRAAAEHA